MNYPIRTDEVYRLRSYGDVRCVDVYDKLKTCDPYSLQELVVWVPERHREVACPCCNKYLWLSSRKTHDATHFRKMIDYTDYNLITDVAEFRYENVETGDFSGASIHIYTMGNLEVNGHKKCLKKVLNSRLRGF